MTFTTNQRNFGANPAFAITFSLTAEEIEKAFEENEAPLLRDVSTKVWERKTETEKLTLCARLAALAARIAASELEGTVSVEPKTKGRE